MQVGPEAGGGEVVLDRAVVEPPDAPLLHQLGADAEALGHDRHAAGAEGIQVRPPTAQRGGDGQLDALKIRPQPELAQALQGTG